MKLGIRGQLLLFALGLIAVTILAAYAFLRSELEATITDRIRADLAVRVDLVALEAATLDADHGDLESWDRLADDLGKRAKVRVTFIRRDGIVLGDSEVATAQLASVENHASRPEVIQALESGRGQSMRRSTTIQRRLMYSAAPFSRDGQTFGTARVALPLTELDAALASLRGILLIAFVIAIGVAAALSVIAVELASRGARSLTSAARRMADGQLETRTGANGSDELGQLGRALDHLAGSLSESLAQLRTERDRMEAILDGLQEGVFLLDAEGKFVLINPAVRDMLLVGPDALGKTPKDVVRHDELTRLIEQATDTHEAVSAEIEVAGLEPRRLLVHVTTLSGDPGGILAAFFDVTELRRLETLRKDFMDNVSHELRTPVTAIQSAAETLKTAALDDPTAAPRFVEMIERNSERLRALVEDLLNLARVEARDFRLEKRPMSLAAEVPRILGLYQDLAAKNDVALRCDISTDLPDVNADGRTLEHVLGNLIDNALKYGGSGGKVVVDAIEEDDFVRVSVQDDGPGIESAHLARLFERFYRVDSGRSRELGGTGLGLAIVKHLVGSMGGTVGVESAVGEGTTFSFTLERTAD